VAASTNSSLGPLPGAGQHRSPTNRTLLVLGACVRKELLVARRRTWDTVSLGLRPLVALLPFMLLAWHAPESPQRDPRLFSAALSFFIWILGQNVAIAGSTFVYSAVREGGLEQLLTLPVSRGALFTGHGLGSLCRELLGTILGLAVVAIAGLGLGMGMPVVSWLGVATAIALLLTTMWGMGVVLGGITLLSRRMDYTFMTISLVALLAGPVYSPEVYPPGIKILSMASPMTFPLNLFRHFALGSPLLMPPGQEVIGSVLWAAFLLIAGARMFEWAVLRTRRMGSAGLF